jgi:hypothetical protein
MHKNKLKFFIYFKNSILDILSILYLFQKIEISNILKDR